MYLIFQTVRIRKNKVRKKFESMQALEDQALSGLEEEQCNLSGSSENENGKEDENEKEAAKAPISSVGRKRKLKPMVTPKSRNKTVKVLCGIPGC